MFFFSVIWGNRQEYFCTLSNIFYFHLTYAFLCYFLVVANYANLTYLLLKFISLFHKQSMNFTIVYISNLFSMFLLLYSFTYVIYPSIHYFHFNSQYFLKSIKDAHTYLYTHIHVYMYKITFKGPCVNMFKLSHVL